MRKLMMAVAVAGLAVVGCQQKGGDVQEKVQDVTQAQQELQQKEQEVAQGGAGQEDLAKAQEDVRKEQQELGEARAEEESQLAEGGSGTAGTTAGATTGATTDTMASATTVQGSVKSAKKDSLVLSVPGQANNQLNLKTDAQTRVMQNNREVKLDDLKEGAQVRASYVSQGSDMLAREITVISPMNTPADTNKMQ